MVKTPSIRQGKPQRDPVTIDLEAERLADAASEPAKPYVGPPSHAEEADASSMAGPSPAKDTAAPEAENDYPTAFEAAERKAGLDDETVRAGDEPEIDREPVRGASMATDRPEPSRHGSFADRPTPSPPVPPRLDATGRQSRRSALPLLAAGIVGGLIALGGAGALQWSGAFGPAATDSSADIASLRGEIDALKANAGGDLAGQVSGLGQALEQVRADVTALQQAAPAGGAETTALDGRIEQLETAIAALQRNGGGAPQDLTGLTERLAGVEALVRQAGDAGSAVDGRLGALEQSLAALTQKVDAQAGQPKVALAIAAAALKSAIERGTPFEAEIETLAAIAPGADVEGLRAHAATGVPTRADIASGMDGAARAIIAAANPPGADAGFFERLLGSAESLVTVRPIGAVEGDGVPQIVARMEVAVNAGDYAGALSEYDTLPDAAKAAGAAFTDKLRARQTVEQLADQVIAAAMKAE